MPSSLRLLLVLFPFLLAYVSAESRFSVAVNVVVAQESDLTLSLKTDYGNCSMERKETVDRTRVFTLNCTLPTDTFDGLLQAQATTKGYVTPASSRLHLSPSSPSFAFAHPLLSIAVSLSCQEHYYGKACARQCRAIVGGHFHMVCDEEGNRHCMDGWTGIDCSRRECKDCVHGECDIEGVCLCKKGFTGPKCDECIPSADCKHGTCLANVPNTCGNCQKGWSGRACHIDQSFCDRRSPCSEGSKCLMTGPEHYECICPPGRTGRHCGIAIATMTGVSICSQKDVCYNGGQCRPLVVTRRTRRFECACPRGYEGDWCQIAVCTPGVCENEGVCETSRDGERLHCRCPYGYTGDRCEVGPRHVEVVKADDDSIRLLVKITLGMTIFAILSFIFCSGVLYVFYTYTKNLRRRLCGYGDEGTDNKSAHPSPPTYKQAMETGSLVRINQYKVEDADASPTRYTAAPTRPLSIANLTESPGKRREEKIYEEL